MDNRHGKTNQTTRESEERYRAFIANSSEGIWRLEFDPPIDTSLPVDTQVDLAYRDGRFAECNDVMARMYGLTRAEDLVGKTLAFMLPPSDEGARAYLASIIRAGYRTIEAESTERDVDGNRRHFANSMTGVVEDGHLLRVWGTQREISDTKRAAAAHAYLAAIVDSSDDAILSKDLDGIIQSCNRAAERLFGYAAAELIGRPVRMLIPPERQAEEDDILDRLRRGERVDHFETARITKDGRLVDISLTISPVRDASGAIIGVSKIARDITDRKRAAAELAAQQAWFRVTLASIGDAVIASNANGVITFMNGTAEALTGWSARAAEGRPLGEVFQIVNEKTRQPVENPAALVMRLGTIVGLANHTILIAHDGVERPIAESGAPIRDADGRILGVVLVFRDVTEQRRAEEAIAEQREWFETTLESIGDAVIATDVQGRIVFMNPVAEHLTGWRVDAARDRACMEVFNVVHEITRRRVENPVSRVLADGAVVGLANHTLLIAADGTARPIDDSGAPIRNRDGRIVGVVLVFRDVTERRRAELERQTAAAEREQLLEAERVARTEAERASRVKDDFVGMVSHELRTPLNAILGWTQLMMRNRGDATIIDRGLEVVARNTRAQAQLISDLLDISRIVAGKLRLDIERVDLAAIITDAIDTVQPEAASKGIVIHTNIESVVGMVAGDPARLQQVVWNLLSNAIKFTPQGGHVGVTLRSDFGEAAIEVVDDGAGIRRDFLPHIFDRFHQADRSTTRRFGGLGLGLSIVKHLVELHGGAVRAESAGERRGSTFTIVLPTSAVPTIEEEHRLAEALASGDVVSLDGLRVLVVEDEPDTREFLTRLLEPYGADVTAAASAQQALSLFQESLPDMLISDIGLPEINGYELMQRIRRLDVTAGGAIPAIALTAYARSEDRTRALRAGYNAHIAKPVESGELVAAIASLAGLVEAQRRNR